MVGTVCLIETTDLEKAHLSYMIKKTQQNRVKAASTCLISQATKYMYKWIHLSTRAQLLYLTDEFQKQSFKVEKTTILKERHTDLFEWRWLTAALSHLTAFFYTSLFFVGYFAQMLSAIEGFVSQILF